MTSDPELDRRKDLYALRVMLELAAAEMTRLDPLATTNAEWKATYESLWRALHAAANAFHRLRALAATADERSELRPFEAELRALLGTFERIAGASGIERP